MNSSQHNATGGQIKEDLIGGTYKMHVSDWNCTENLEKYIGDKR
jgi:hypothetical protein